MKFLLTKVKVFYNFNKTIEAECARTSTRRIFLGIPVAISIHSAMILVIGLSKISNDASSILWKRSLMITHGTMLLFMLVCFLITYYLQHRNEKPLWLAKFLQYFIMSELAAGGIALAAIDQLVTTNITPYILVSLIAGTLLLIHPLHSLLHYIISFIAFYFVMSGSRLPNDMLLSNLLNGLAVAVLGFLLTFLLWRHNQTNFIQRKRILEQSMELEAANQKLEKLAFFDSLTGLPNRQYFDLALQKEISLNYRMGYDSYLIMLDIDLFKNINDMYGHPIGDALLIEIGKLLSGNIRKYDTLCRLGGEEFLLLLPQTNTEEALSVAEKLRGILESHTFCIKDHILHVTASFGVSQVSYTSDPRIIAQYAQVDNALYLAKQCGRNCVKSA